MSVVLKTSISHLLSWVLGSYTLPYDHWARDGEWGARQARLVRHR